MTDKPNTEAPKSEEKLPEAFAITPEEIAAKAAFEEEYGPIALVNVRKPVAGVVQGEIPAMLAKLLEVEVPKALKDPDYELQLTAKDESKVKKLAGYARAWGGRQEPKLYIHKVPNRRDMPANVARLVVELESNVAAENRPGRRRQS
jgi:hypothetical protein